MARPITICHPIWRLDSGGLERQLLQVAMLLPANRFRHLIVTASPGELDAAALPSHVTLIHERTRVPDPMWSHRLARILRAHRTDILHIRNFGLLLDGLSAADRAQGVRTVFSFHGLESAAPAWPRWRARIHREALLRCDARWTVSRRAATELASVLGCVANSFDEIPNGVDTSRFAPAADRRAIRSTLGLPLDRPVVLTVGNLKPVKGQDLLIDAVARMGNDASSATFVFVGRDEFGGSLQRAAGSIKSADIRFVGPRQDTAAWYQAADLFVLPSRWEGCSNALLEAMATGLACVATDAGGNGELIDHERTGLLVPSGESKPLAEAIRRLLNDPMRRNCLGAAARSRIDATHALPIALARYADRYSTLAEGPGSRASAARRCPPVASPAVGERG